MKKKVVFPILSVSCISFIDYVILKEQRRYNLSYIVNGLIEIIKNTLDEEYQNKNNKEPSLKSYIAVNLHHILSEFINKTIYQTVDVFTANQSIINIYEIYCKHFQEKNKNNHKKVYKLFELQAELCVKVWLCLEFLSLPNNYCCVAFIEIIKELELISLIAYEMEEGFVINSNVRKIIRKRESENRLLQKRTDNPFDQDVFPFTSHFIQLCFETANTNSNCSEFFANNLYKPMIYSRMDVIQQVIELNPIRYVQSPDGRVIRLQKTGRHREK